MGDWLSGRLSVFMEQHKKERQIEKKTNSVQYTTYTNAERCGVLESNVFILAFGLCTTGANVYMAA